ncbi:MAG: cation-transporting P-type ATPase [Lutibacter sp.]|nr:cation-transporting P-type ATPase [Lutibacter sp.]
MDSLNINIVKNPHALTSKNVVIHLNSDVEFGLEKTQIKERIKQFGKNEIPLKKPKTKWRILADQFLNSIIYILTAAALLAFLFRDWAEGIAILIVILITVSIGFFMELQALRSLETLRKMGQAETSVLRDGKLFRLKASFLVPGDIIILEAGDVVSTDARLLSTENLTTKEAALTGESAHVEKKTESLPVDTPIVEQNNMVFKGTLVTRGSAKAIVTSTGSTTELGKIQLLGTEVDAEITPLEKKLRHLGKWLIWLTLLLTVVIVITGTVRGVDFVFMLQTGIALAVASIPEGLPIVATIALAQGMIKLSKKQVIIKKLEAVHTLGATNIICTDKTGTLTEDQMKVHTLVFENASFEKVNPKNKDELNALKNLDAFEKMMMAAMLCNDSIFTPTDKHGDSIDLALTEFALDAGYDLIAIKKNNPEKMEVAFDADRKMMATVNKHQKTFHVYAKGAYESIVECCDSILKNGKSENFGNKAHWHKKVDDLASHGLRVLAFAHKESETNPAYETLLQQLTFIGLVGFIDPARKDVKATIATYKSAGISVVMMTGDHPGTAKKIAQEIGLLELDAINDKVLAGKNIPNMDNLSETAKNKLLNAVVFARVTPKQKLDLIALFQQNNNIVGMIGDGVNDVPALKKADIGIAMGIRGTEAARETADVILKDDKFTSIELAIKQGRAIFENIRQFVVYLLSSNLAEIISIGIAALLALPSPLLPLQILFLNLITDIFPALALGLGKGEIDIMNKPPRKPDEPIMTYKLWKATLIYGLCITAGVLGITAYSHFILKLPPNEINNMAFFTLIFAQLLNVFNMPKSHLSFFKNEVTLNPWIWYAIALSVFITAAAIFTPPIAKALSITGFSLDKFGFVILFGFGALLLTQIFKRIGSTV